MAETRAQKAAKEKAEQSTSSEDAAGTAESTPEATTVGTDGTRLVRMHTNVGTLRDGKEYQLTADECSALVPTYGRYIDEPGAAPAT